MLAPHARRGEKMKYTVDTHTHTVASTHAYRGPARCLTLHSAALNPNTNCAAAGEEDAEEMAAAEKHIMQALGWKGQGLIAAAGSADGLHGDPEGGSGDGSGGGGSRGA
jgi:hypothetical protein